MDRNKKSKHYKINFFFLARTEKENYLKKGKSLTMKSKKEGEKNW